MSGPNITHEPTNPVPVIKGSLPRPAGSIIQSDRLSDYEKSVLVEKFGYDGVSDVPSDLANRMENAEFQKAFDSAAKAAPEGWQEPVGLDPSKVTTVYDEAGVTAEAERITKRFEKLQQEAKPKPDSKFEEVRSSAVQEIKQAAADRNVHPDLQKALSDLKREVAADENKAASSPEPTENQFSEEKVDSPEPEVDVDTELRSRVSKEDADAFRQAVINFGTFTKSYEIMGGAVTVTFGDHGVEEYELLVRQESLDKQSGRIDANLTEILTNANTLSLGMALRRVDTPNGRPVDVPENMPLSDFLRQTFPDRSVLNLTGLNDNDTDLRVWSRFLTKTVLKGSFSHLIYQKFEEFKGLMQALRYISKEPEFFKTPAQ